MSNAYTMKNFVNRRLINNPNLNVGIDYQEVSSTHILVIQYKQRWSIMTNEPANKKYYIITIKTFKYLLMKSNTENSHNYREYMLKLEHLVIVVSDYNARLLEYKHEQSQRAVLQEKL